MNKDRKGGREGIFILKMLALPSRLGSKLMLGLNSFKEEHHASLRKLPTAITTGARLMTVCVKSSENMERAVH